MIRICLLAFVFCLVLASVALGQDPAAAAQAADGGTVMPGPLGWIKFVVDLGVSGVLSVGVYKLWKKLEDKEAEFLGKETAWVKATADAKADALKEKTDAEADRAKEKADAEASWVLERATLKDNYEKEADRAWEEARQDKTALRVSFEAEKAKMLSIYTEKIDQLQGKLEKERDDRRVEAERLLREQNVLTREVMRTAHDMAVSLQENTKAIDKFNDSNPA